MIKTDIPRQKIAEDDYCRRNLVELIANSIICAAEQDHPSISYGVFGKWGEGKTTVLNFVEEKLLSNPNDNICIVKFNPWIINDEESLIRYFFDSIVRNVDDELKQCIIKYADLFSYTAKYIGKLISIPGFGEVISKFIDDTKKAVQGYNKSISELKEDISKTIIESKKHLLVIIDDIDRLDNNEIHLMFRLVRQIADFKNTIYLLAMDKDIVSIALGKYIGLTTEDGANFLDKVIQIPILLPTIPKYLISKEIGEKLKSIFERFALKESTNNIANQLSCLIQTPRQLLRYFNQLEFVLPTLYKEINIENLCYLEAIKLISVTAYQKIYYYKDALLKHIDQIEMFIDRNKALQTTEDRYTEAIDDIVQNVPNYIQNSVRNTLYVMFANKKQNFNYMKDFSRKSIDSDLFFSTYFIQYVPNGVMPREEIDDLKNIIDSMSIDELVEWINSKFQIYDAQNICRAFELILYECTDFITRCKLVEKIIIALCTSNLSDGYNYDIKSQSITDVMCCKFLTNYTYEITDSNESQEYNEPTIINVLTHIYKIASIQMCMHLNATIRHSFTNLEEFNKKSFEPFRERFIDLLSYEEQTKYCSFLLRNFFFTWQSIAANGPIEYLRTALSNRYFNLIQFLYAFLNSDKQSEIDFQTLFGDISTEVKKSLEFYKTDPKYEDMIKLIDKMNM